MMMDSVAEEHPLGIHKKILILRAFTVSLVIPDDILDHMPYRQVVTAVLRPENVSAIFRSLRKMIDILLLRNGQAVPTRNLIAHYLQIREFINEIFEIPLIPGRSAGHGCRGSSAQNQHFDGFFHYLIFNII